MVGNIGLKILNVQNEFSPKVLEYALFSDTDFALFIPVIDAQRNQDPQDDQYDLTQCIFQVF